MAVSNNFRTSNQYIIYYVEMIQNSQSITNNTSNVTVRVWVRRTNTYGPTFGSGTVYCTINGTQYTASMTSSDRIGYSAIKVFERTLNIPHSSNGSKTLTISARIQHSQFSSSNQSARFTLTTIPRYVKITSYSISDIRCKDLKISYNTDKAINATQYRLNSGTWRTFPSNGVIDGLSPNTSYRVQIRVRSTQSNLWTESANRAIKTLALSTITSPPNFNLERYREVEIKRASSSMRHDVSLEAYYDGAWKNVELETERVNIATETTLTPSPASVDLLWQKHVNTKTIKARLKLVTKWDGEVQGTTYKDSVITITNANPNIANVTYKDTNSTVQAIVQDDQTLLRNISTLQIKTGVASAVKYANLKRYIVRIGGSQHTLNTNAQGETNKIINVGKVDFGTNQRVTLTVEDTRGYMASETFTIKMIDYKEPQFLDVQAERLNNYEEQSYVKSEARRSMVLIDNMDKNNLFVRARVKGATEQITGIVQLNDPNSSLNMRSGPGTQYEVVGALLHGDIVTILGLENNFYKIKDGAGVAYVSADYVAIEDDGPSEGEWGNWVNLNVINSYDRDTWQYAKTNSHIGDFPNEKSFTVEVQLKDEFTDWRSTIVTLPEGIPLMEFRQNRVTIQNNLELLGANFYINNPDVDINQGWARGIRLGEVGDTKGIYGFRGVGSEYHYAYIGKSYDDHSLRIYDDKVVSLVPFEIDTPPEVYQCTLQNGWSGDLEYIVQGNIVCLYGSLNAGVIAAGTVITVLPREHSPLAITSMVAHNGSKSLAFVGLSLTTAGNFYVRNPAPEHLSQGDTGVRVSVTYMIQPLKYRTV